MQVFRSRSKNGPWVHSEWTASDSLYFEVQWISTTKLLLWSAVSCCNGQLYDRDSKIAQWHSQTQVWRWIFSPLWTLNKWLRRNLDPVAAPVGNHCFITCKAVIPKGKRCWKFCRVSSMLNCNWSKEQKGRDLIYLSILLYDYWCIYIFSFSP